MLTDEIECDVTIDRVRRVLSLIEAGVPPSAIRAALHRSTDGEDLGRALGVIEDLHFELRVSWGGNE